MNPGTAMSVFDRFASQFGHRPASEGVCLVVWAISNCSLRPLHILPPWGKLTPEDRANFFTGWCGHSLRSCRYRSLNHSGALNFALGNLDDATWGEWLQRIPNVSSHRTTNRYDNHGNDCDIIGNHPHSRFFSQGRCRVPPHQPPPPKTPTPYRQYHSTVV